MHYICEDVQYGGGLSIAIHVHVYVTYRYNQAVLMVCIYIEYKFIQHIVCNDVNHW